MDRLCQKKFMTKCAKVIKIHKDGRGGMNAIHSNELQLIPKGEIGHQWI